MARIPTTAARLVVLIDGENFAAKHVEALMTRAGELGSIVEVRVYGHYDHRTMSGWTEAADRLGLTKVNVTVKGENSADFQLTIEAVDMLHARNLDVFCIASSDTGFSGLARRIRSSAVRVYGLGEKKASDEYRAYFDDFIVMDTARKASARSSQPRTAAKSAAPPAKEEATKERSRSTTTRKESPKAQVAQSSGTQGSVTLEMIQNAIDNVKRDGDGWAQLQQVGDFLRKNHSGLPKQLHLWQKVKKMLKLESRTNGRSHFIRRKPAS
jgi:uncharacterized protein (DUF4415 family)